MRKSFYLLFLLFIFSSFTFPYKEFKVHFSSYNKSSNKNSEGYIYSKNGLFMIEPVDSPFNYSLFVNDTTNYVYEKSKGILYIYKKWYNNLGGAILGKEFFYNFHKTDYGYLGIPTKPKNMQIDSVRIYINKKGLPDSIEEFLAIRYAFITKKDYTIFRFDHWDSVCPEIKFPEEPKETIDVQGQMNKIFGGE